jgi:hypothetical protein
MRTPHDHDTGASCDRHDRVEAKLLILDMALDGLRIMQRLRSKAGVGSRALVMGPVRPWQPGQQADREL